MEHQIEKQWHTTYTGKVYEINEERITLVNECYYDYVDSYNGFKMDSVNQLDATQVNVGDVVQMQEIRLAFLRR